MVTMAPEGAINRTMNVVVVTTVATMAGLREVLAGMTDEAGMTTVEMIGAITKTVVKMIVGIRGTIRTADGKRFVALR